MEDYIGTQEQTIESIPSLLEQKAPETMESALHRIDSLRYLLQETHRAYTHSQMDIIRLKVVIGFLSCMVGAILIATILGAIFES